IAGKIEEIPVADSRFDGVISWGVIEHNGAGPKNALSEFFRILKPGGYAIVTVPFEDALAIRSSKIQFEKRQSPSVFFQHYMTTRELRDYLLGSGFEVVDSGLHPPASLGKILPRIFMGSERLPKIQVLLINLFGIIFYWKTDWYFMTYAVGKRP